METKIETNEKITDEIPQNKGGISKNTLITIIMPIILATVFGFIAGGAGYYLSAKISNKINNITGKTGTQNGVTNQLVEEDSAVINVVTNNSPAVVSIVISKDVPVFKSFFNDPFGFDPFGGSTGETEKQKVGGGSGFFVSSDGMIVTNKHVVSDMEADYTVVTSDGKEHKAKVLARHPSQDIAIIQVEGNNYPIVNLGDSDNLKVGQTVVAIGYSLGEFSNSVSKGIISGLKRNLTAGSGYGQTEKLDNIIQTDAAINPGNSGGPLLDIGGNVIGVNVAMAQGAENVGFALPINQVKKIIETVKKDGKISIPYLGVRYVIIDETIKSENNLPFAYGALVLRGEKMTDFAVVPGSLADKTGLVENDIILEIEGKKVDADNPLAEIIAEYSVGDTLTLKVWHKGETKEVKVKLEARS